MFLEKRELETYFRKISGRSYDREFEGFICRDSFGKLISPEYVTSRFHYVINKKGLRHLRFHDLRFVCKFIACERCTDEGYSGMARTFKLFDHGEPL